MTTATDWDTFNAAAYERLHYRRQRPEDVVILKRLCALVDKVRPSTVVDIGTGPNLTAVLAVLPWASMVTCIEPSLANRRWLDQTTLALPTNWWQVWGLVQSVAGPVVQGVDMQRRLKSIQIKNGSLFTLTPGMADMATMLFVAESITDDKMEAAAGITAWLAAGTKGGFAAFMAGSEGYTVDGVNYPAVALTAGEVREIVCAVKPDAVVRDLPIRIPIRSGYTGMITAEWCAHGNNSDQ